MKTCTTCNEEKPLLEFFFRNKIKKRLHCICKSCKRKKDKILYDSNESRKIKMRLNALRSIERAYQFVKRIKGVSFCLNCNDKRHYVLDFHHVRGIKEQTISEMVSRGSSINRIKNEIRKCNILCANCHREEHYINSGRS